MPKFSIVASIHASKWIGVFEAENEEAAIEKAWASKTCTSSVCHQCSSNFEDPEVAELFAEQVDDNEELCINESP